MLEVHWAYGATMAPSRWYGQYHTDNLFSLDIFSCTHFRQDRPECSGKLNFLKFRPSAKSKPWFGHGNWAFNPLCYRGSYWTYGPHFVLQTGASEHHRGHHNEAINLETWVVLLTLRQGNLWDVRKPRQHVQILSSYLKGDVRNKCKRIFKHLITLPAINISQT